MTLSLRTGALALALLAGSALVAGPALADRGHHGRWDDRSWSKSWNKKHYKHRNHGYAHRHHGKKWRGYPRYGAYGYGGPRYRYGYGWPGYYAPRSGFGFGIRIY
jgi:hypothetical protein